MQKARKLLATIWFVGGGLLFALVGMQSLLGRYGQESGRAWDWLLAAIMPSLSLIVGVLFAEVRGLTEPGNGCNPFVMKVAALMSSAYLLSVAATILLSPFSALPILELMKESNIWLGALQGLVAASLGAFFVSKPTGPEEAVDEA